MIWVIRVIRECAAIGAAPGVFFWVASGFGGDDDELDVAAGGQASALHPWVRGVMTRRPAVRFPERGGGLQ